MQNNFRKKRDLNTRPNYLKYDDVFMSQNSPNRSNNNQPWNRQKQQSFINESLNEDYEETDYMEDNFEQYTPSQDNSYFSNNNIINEKMIKYQKRQLPQLQRYSESSRKSMYSRLPTSYWEDNDEYQTSFSRNHPVFGNVWQKFFIIFTSILSLVCLSWIAYNWNNEKANKEYSYQNGPIIIEPEQDNFKVLPDDPGGEKIPYRDKTVYEKVAPGMAYMEKGENLLPPQEEPLDISSSPRSYQSNNVEEYSIVDEKVYYIKISAGKTKNVLLSEAKLLKKRFSNVIVDKACLVKKVSNTEGEKKYAILIGPYDSQETAAYTARKLGGECYVISVKE
ncbi:MAG: SPOR domain-containing protein [Holosporales bacterium]|nr:SPOR domain-containing protein [Holosporales bacterium]